ncbi:hypothetical protein [Streptomyces sp. NPDC051577]|uniref:hypothetical protein n=1 Tax=Streptomyces sp. NPDC051577 TaxID=3155166 RepID=UPI003444C4A6
MPTRQTALASDGGFTAGTAVLATRGLTSGAFLAWMERAIAGDEAVFLAAHPEHDAMAPTGSVGDPGMQFPHFPAHMR